MTLSDTSPPEAADAQALPLVEAAWAARARAHCEYSGFAVGVALQTHDGAVHTGANVENASYNLGQCAERVAMYHALTHGANQFTVVVIATDTPAPTYPCGACRQVLWEFAPDAEIWLSTAPGTIALRTTVAATLPAGFDKSALST